MVAKLWTVALVAALATTSACRSTVAPDSTAPSAGTAAASEGARPAPAAAARRPDPAPQIPAEVPAEDIPTPAVDVSPAFGDATLGKLRHDALLRAVYAERAGAAFLASADSVLTKAGAAAMEALGAAEAHALDPSRYRLAEIKALRQDLATRVAAIEQGGAVPVDPAERAALESLGTAEYRETHVMPDGLELLRKSIAAGPSGPLPKTVAAVAARTHAFEELASLAARLELLLADGMLSWATDMRFGNTRTLSKEEVKKRGAAKIVAERVEAFLREVVATPDTLGDTLATIPPGFPQYAKLLEGLKRYRGLCAAGPWPTVAWTSRKPLKAGATGAVVDTVRTRLRAEGFTVPDAAPGAPFDAGLELAINDYRSTHQMELKGVIDKELSQSLDISCERRVAQIELTLQRWRESRNPDPNAYFVFVNLPDFHGEVWDQGTRLHRFRVVVGNRTRGFNRLDPKSGFKNATPRLAAKIQYLEFNPYWNVPDRIRTEELEPELAKDPNYLGKHGYEMVEEGGREWIRQLPGRGNALGRVKFLFPNPWDVYLHDTNQRDLFDKVVRSFSHGCMRVHEPMKLAELLLTREGKWDPSIVDSRKFTPVTLDSPIPIYVEYYVVRVDDDGRVHFNLDLYGLDKKRLDG